MIRKHMIWMILLSIGFQFSFVIHGNSGPATIEEHESFAIVPANDEDISVISEHLIFDFSRNEFNYLGQMYADVQANYTMRNAAATKTLTMAFPYITSLGNFKDPKTVVEVNQEILEPTIHYGRMPYDIDLNTLSFATLMQFVIPSNDAFDDALKGTFIRLRTPEEGLEISFQLNPSTTRIVFDKIYYRSWADNVYTMKSSSHFVGDFASLYVIGDDITILSNNATETLITELSYNDYVAQITNKAQGDPYYARTITELRSFINQNDVTTSQSSLLNVEYNPMFVILVYEATIIGDNVDNQMSITFEMLDTTNLRTRPPIHEYYYLLSPAKHWASFSSLTIDILLTEDMPYLIDASFPFEAIDEYQYRFFSETLPEENLYFLICESENPRVITNGYVWIAVFIITSALVIVAIGLVPVIILIKVSRLYFGIVKK